MPIDPIDERFAFITQDGTKYQVLLLDEETGNPIDWDEAATAALIPSHNG